MNKTRKITPLLLISLFLIPALSVLGYFGYQKYIVPRTMAPTPVATLDDQTSGQQLVSAEGKVIPNELVRAGFVTAGTVETVAAQEGQEFEAGQVLASLQGQQRLLAAIDQAELELLSAQQDLQALYDNAELALAQARQSVIDAEQAVKKAQRVVDSINQKGSKEQIEAAEAAVTLADAALKKARKSAAAAKKDSSTAKKALLQLAIYAAERQYTMAVARLNALQGTMSEDQQEQARAELEVARATLKQCEREAELLASGPNPDQVALATTRVENAQSQLDAAQASLEDLKLRAPISGTVVKVDVKTGDYVVPGTPLIFLADLSTWKVETTNLSESDAVALSPGMPATIVLDALPDQKFQGTVVEIGYYPEEWRGGVTYKVTLEFDPQEAAVRWGMTALVDIELDK